MSQVSSTWTGLILSQRSVTLGLVSSGEPSAATWWTRLLCGQDGASPKGSEHSESLKRWGCSDHFHCTRLFNWLIAELPVVVEAWCSELHGEGVVELLHADHAVSVMVESSHQSVFFVVSNEDIHAIKKVNTVCNAFVTYLLSPSVNSAKLILPSLFLSSFLSRSIAYACSEG